MQKLAKYLLLVVFSLLSTNALAGRTAPLVNGEAMPVASSSGKKLSAAQVKQAILDAAKKADWTAASTGDGKIVATLQVRGKHTLVTEISYNPESYTVRYKDSVNLNHGFEELEQTNYKPVEVIHPNANKWMAQLREAIRGELMRL